MELFSAPIGLPQVMDCAAEFGVCDKELFGLELPIRGVAGDNEQQPSDRLYQSGALKSTYGTGCFVIINTGNKALASKNKLLTTIAYKLAGETSYALEGSIFVSGAIIH